MDPDTILAVWAKQNAETIYRHLETKVNPGHNWRSENIVDVVADNIGWPSEAHPEPYVEELPHVLNSNEEDFGIPIPFEVTAHKLSLWADNSVPVTHPLVQDREKWYNVILDMEFDNADPESAVELVRLLHTIARGEAADNLPSVEDMTSHHEAPIHDGHLYTVATEDGMIYLAVAENSVAAMNSDGNVVVLDFEGNRLQADANMSRIQHYITQGVKFSRPITDMGELASLVGNKTAALLLGADGLSVFDLPNY